MSISTPAAENTPKRKRREGPRAPSRGRGVLRHAALLDATEALLQTESPDDVGLYQIADYAGVPPASVYHFFPTKEAAYTALMQRYCVSLLEIHHVPIEASQVKSWQDLFRIDVRRAMDFYNSNVPARKIMYGGYPGVEARNIDKLLSLKLANAHYERLNRIFHMPFMKDPEKKFEIRISILDAIWTIAVRRSGYITDEYFEEAYNACVAYTRLFLPEQIERRDILVEASERGGYLTLPFDQDGDVAFVS